VFENFASGVYVKQSFKLIKKMHHKKYVVKKGPADPFRGDWYTNEKAFADINEAIEHAANLTLSNFTEFGNSWVQFGYEWSVFEKSGDEEKKVWEGFRYISFVKNGERNVGLGQLNK
jgi:hypothetical protein